MKNKQKKLVFENGTEYFGCGFGADTSGVCEVVLNTSMVGYQEILSDPSYSGQFVCMTYPLIGNYGLADEDYESKVPRVGGFIVREYNDAPSNYRYTQTLSDVLADNGIPGIHGVDTREITRMIQARGGKRAAIVDAAAPKQQALDLIANTPLPRDQVRGVSCKRPWYSRTANYQYNVVALDCGIKHSVIKQLNARKCNVTVAPYDTTAEQIMMLSPDGLLISSGPGNPEEAAPVIELVARLCGRLPIFGIGLGCQIIALANGARVQKAAFGYGGGNIPVRELSTGKIDITAQGRTYIIDGSSIQEQALEITHINLLDGTVAGLGNREKRIFAVQLCPEGAPGPQDGARLFDQFIADMDAFMTERRQQHA